MSFERPQNLRVKEFTDVVFIVDGERVTAHKLILASQSEYFRAMLYGEMKEASQEDIPLPDIPLASFKTVLQYAYTGTLEIEDQLEVSSYVQQLFSVTFTHNGKSSFVRTSWRQFMLPISWVLLVWPQL